jgi:predicted GIY-YIG superfamily endonuclease
VSGLYIFAYKGEQYWHPLYVGQTDDFSARLSCHERWDEAVRKGATHVHALSVSQAAMRDTYEHLLIQNLQPVMNFQLR